VKSGSSDMIIKNLFKDKKVKTLLNISVLLILLMMLINCGSTSNATVRVPFTAADSMKCLEQYSLFSEYHKNKDYSSALPYGWNVLDCGPERFARWFFYKMEETLWFMHDSAGASPELISEVQDSIVGFYDNAIKYHPEDKAYYQVRKAYVKEIWLEAEPDEVIQDYELAFEWKNDFSSFYYNRLGQLYKRYADDTNDYKNKALDLYSMLAERETDNPQWITELEGLAENIDELVQLSKRAWDLDRDNLQKAWRYASMAIRASEFQVAIEPLEFLVGKSPEAINYWNQLASAYQKTDQMTKAEGAYRKLIQLEPNAREHYLNLGINLREQGKLSAARTEFLKANEIGGGWALPIYYEGYLYEQAARSCSDFDAKVVYLLAQQTYRKALSMDGSLDMARDRVNALANAVPTKEDYFFRNLKSGDTLQITCVGWIGRTVTVP
jgi:tetratricopeptide (TPR) repeat protein